MTTSSPKNYNINTLRGVTNDDDLDVCETLGLDPSLAHTPKIITAQLERDVAKNVQRDVLHKMVKPHLSEEEWKQVKL